MTEEIPRDTDSSIIRTAHVGAFVTVWVFGFVVLRIFAVSGYDWETAFVVSTTLSLTDGVVLIFGSLMAGELLTALLLVLAMPPILFGSLWGPRRHRAVLMLLSALGLVLVGALTFSSGTWWLAPAIAGVFGLFALTRRLRGSNRLRRVATVAVARIGWVAPVALLLVAALVPTPWVPLEKIDTTDGPIAAYVLSVDPGYLNVLTDQKRFMILNSGDVISRE